jgi:predicted Rossmann-fold nucleotide-binding protein
MNEIYSLYYLEDYIKKHDNLKNLIFKNLDLTHLSRKLLNYDIIDCIFIGCKLDKDLLVKITIGQNYILPSLNLPFDLFPRLLYSIEDLYGNFNPSKPLSYKNSTDYEIYTHFIDHKNKGLLSPFLQVTESIHDSSMRMALYDYVRRFNNHKKIVGVMGGHKVPRDDEYYERVCLISKRLTEQGYMMVSGGGPGMMEATHLGAYFAHRTDEELCEAIDIMKVAPVYSDAEWLTKSYEVIEKYPPKYRLNSLSIPTWVHGHEPPNPFPARIAKFFSAAIRQEVLIEVTKGAIIYSPGSAGTLREIFQTVEQNHYNMYDNVYPMIFLNKEYWSKTLPAYNFFEDIQKSSSLNNIVVSLEDDEVAIEKLILKLTEG